MAKELPFMPFFGLDFYSSERVNLMPDFGEVLYIRMLWAQWRSGGVPDDPKIVARLVGRDTLKVKKVWAEVRACFELGEDGLLRNTKLEAVRVETLSKRAARSKAASARWEANADANAHAKPDAETDAGMDASTPCKTNAVSKDNNSERENASLRSASSLEDGSPKGSPSSSRPRKLAAAKEGVDLDRLWEEFCLHYPKREGDLGKVKGQQRFRQLIAKGEDGERIIAGGRRYRAFCDATLKTKTQYVKQIPTWLNGRAWEEEWEIPDDAPKPHKNGVADKSHFAKAVAEADEVDGWV